MSPTLTDTELLSRLVGFDSTSCNSNIPIADFVCDYLNDPRIELIRIASPDEKKVNVLARVGPASTDNGLRGGLMLSGHLDTVPAREPDWRSDPFTLTETDDAFFGRGTCDMKGFDALAVNLVRDATELNLRNPLLLLLSYDEEVGLHGAERFVDTYESATELPACVLVGEPTSLRLVRMHKGFAQIRVTCTGISAHSAYPHLGRSAIEPGARIVTALAGLREEFMQVRTDMSPFYPETPFVALNVGTIQGGSAANVVPDRCVLEMSLRVLPDLDSAESVKRVREVVASVPDNGNAKVEILCDNPGVLVQEDSPFYRELQRITGQAETAAVSYSTDAAKLQRLGVECVLLGPGNIDVAHKPNEYLPKAEFAEGRSILERIVREMCS